MQPDQPEIREHHTRAVLNRQAGSHLSAVREFAAFEQLTALKAPAELVQYLESAKKGIAGTGRGEGAIVLDMADSMAEALVSAGHNDPGARTHLREHLAWMWHVWSGQAHGWAWPKYVPGRDDPDHDVAPGHWVTDYFQLTAIVQQAVRLLVDGLTPPPPN